MTKKLLFPLGRRLATPGVLRHLEAHGVDPGDLIARHVTGDYGELDREDVKANEWSIENDARILSAYMVGGEKVYVITEADRSVTTVLLADEY